MSEDTFVAETRRIQQLTNALSRCVVPLFAADNAGIKEMVGSGFLVSSGESTFLVSAAHVFDEHQAGRQLFFYVEPGTTRRLSGLLSMTGPPAGATRAADRLDVGVLLLQGACLPPYPAVDKYCLPLSALRPWALPRSGKHYLITGFPGTKTRVRVAAREVVSKVYGIRNTSAASEEYARVGVTKKFHILVKFDQKRSVFPNGRVSAAPNPAGLSGAPVWLLHDEQSSEPLTPLVGIAVEHHKNRKVIVVTDVGVALGLIHAAVTTPELLWRDARNAPPETKGPGATEASEW